MRERYLNYSLQLDPSEGKTPQEKKHILETWEHIEKVRTNMEVIAKNMANRSNYHDQSKLKEPELKSYSYYGAQLRNYKYGSPEYFQMFNSPEFRVGLDHHYANNSHHPEYYPNGIRGMSMMDILEMMADWKAAAERTKEGNLKDSFAYNKKRFDIPDDIFNMMERTAKELGWL